VLESTPWVLEPTPFGYESKGWNLWCWGIFSVWV
jgi:hypothetical protein